MKRVQARRVVAATGAGDRWLLRRWMRQHPHPLDESLLTLSRAADHSVLWIVLAAALALGGGQRGRRAAQRGLVAIALASATVNGPLKLSVRRRRPERGRHQGLHRHPRTFSFPSGHSASAFAFATAATRELPAAGPLLLPLAGAVAYSRVYLGVHYPSDVILGSAIGAAASLAAPPVARAIALPEPTPAQTGRGDLTNEAVLVISPHAGGSAGLDRARRTIADLRISIVEQLEIEQIDRLPALIHTPDGRPRLVIAAGGDGTVGAVADCLAGSDSVLGVLPLGTSNDFARSLGIPVNPRRAAKLLDEGKIATVDLGRLTAPGQPVRHFAHAATVGLNVNFAKLATRASMRERFGRLTYLVAAATALREHPTFDCEVHYDGRIEQLTLSQLSVINAPTFGGALGMRVGGSNPDDRLLDILAIEHLPPHKILRAALYLILRVHREVAGVRALHVQSLRVHTERPLDVALDGEVIANLPGEFEVAGEALRVITPLEFEDIDD